MPSVVSSGVTGTPRDCKPVSKANMAITMRTATRATLVAGARVGRRMAYVETPATANRVSAMAQLTTSSTVSATRSQRATRITR